MIEFHYLYFAIIQKSFIKINAKFAFSLYFDY